MNRIKKVIGKIICLITRSHSWNYGQGYYFGERYTQTMQCRRCGYKCERHLIPSISDSFTLWHKK